MMATLAFNELITILNPVLPYAKEDTVLRKFLYSFNYTLIILSS